MKSASLSQHRYTTTVFTLLLFASSVAFAQHYQRTDLTADSSAVSATATIDTNLVNAWGVSRSSGSFWWISDNGKGLSTLYDATGAIGPLVVTIPPPMNGAPPSAPTGTVFNFTKGFEVAPGVPAIFLFVTEDGTISGWNPGVSVTSAVLKVDNSKRGAIYKGCALAMTPFGPRLYVTNFATGRVEMYNSSFRYIKSEDAFQGLNLPSDYSPFGIQNVGGNIVVTFAHRMPGSRDEDHGPGLGRVAIFNDRGALLLRLPRGAFMNAPWGIAMAPGDFGAFSHRLLIGNFGDGTIHAFNSVSGRFEGALLNPNGSPLTIEGLWGLSFGGDTVRNGLATELFFTAGPNDENDGLFGKITAVSTELRGNAE